MTKDILFRWEDSPSLKHHCGFCKRPLNHPGAKSSCIGTHAEPCHRFHQQLHMRNRGHCCAPCRGTDEAHHRRHAHLAELLRDIYDLRGDDPWIGGDDRVDRADSGVGISEGTSEDGGSNSDIAAMKRKARKDFRKLERAKGRVKVVTMEELRYLDSVLHPESSNADGSAPVNLEEVEEIERNLRYNANVYNTGYKRTLLKNLNTSVLNADVDFEHEMERILCILTIRDPVKRDVDDTRDLAGKDLARFKRLVKSLVEKIVEDLVLVKKDELETRMRRASFLRYTNRTGFDIIQDRYSTMDWKTGERFTSTPPREDETEQEMFELAPEDDNDNLKENKAWSDGQADVRHIAGGHRRLDSDGEPGVKLVPPNAFATPKKLEIPSVTSLPPTLRITSSSSARDKVKGKTSRRTASIGITQPVKTYALAASSSPDLPSRSNTPYQFRPPPLQSREPNTPTPIAPRRQLPGLSKDAFPSLGTSELKAAVPPAGGAWGKSSSQNHNAPPTGGTQEGHAPVVQKKVKKTRDKPRKAAQYAKPTELTMSSLDATPEQEPFKEQITVEDPQPLAGQTHVFVNKDRDDLDKTIVPPPLLPSPPSSPLASRPQRSAIPRTFKGQHRDWKLFTRQLVLDGLSDPITDSAMCAHACSHRGSNVADCSFHPTCPRYDAPADTVFLVYPSPNGPLSTGPFNRLRGEKLLRFFNISADDIVKGRLMLVDKDIFLWVTRQTNSRPCRIEKEMKDLITGFKEGPGLRQETRYNTLSMTNASRARQPEHEHLQRIMSTFEPKGAQRAVCYCEDHFCEKEQYVQCCHRDCPFGGLFHTKCVRATYIEGMKEWYCHPCDVEMKHQANDLIASLPPRRNTDDNAEDDHNDNDNSDNTTTDENVDEANWDHVRFGSEDLPPPPCPCEAVANALMGTGASVAHRGELLARAEKAVRSWKIDMQQKIKSDPNLKKIDYSKLMEFADREGLNRDMMVNLAFK